MVGVGRSVRSYVCAGLLSTREGSPSKGGLPLHCSGDDPPNTTMLMKAEGITPYNKKGLFSSFP